MRTRARRVFNKESRYPWFAWRPVRVQFKNLAPSQEAHPNVRLWVWWEQVERRRDGYFMFWPFWHLHQYFLPTEETKVS